MAGSTTTDLMTLKSDGLRVKGTKVSLEGHTHTIANITNIGSASVNYANSAGSVAWGNVTGKPSYYSSNWLSLNSQLTYGASGLNYFNLNMPAGSTANQNQSPIADWWHIIRMNHGNASGYYVDLGFCFHQNYVAYRRIVSGTSNGWIRILDSSNYNSYSPTLTGGGASGTWNINVNGTSNSLNFIASVTDANQAINNGNGYNINGITYWRGTNSTKNIPTGASNAWGIMNLGMGGNHGTSYQYAAQIYVGTQGSAPYFRKQAGGNFNAWREFAFIDSNVASATKLQTPRSINGTNFDGTANITTATWGNARTLTLSGNASGSVSINGGSNVTLSVSNNYATNAGALENRTANDFVQFGRINYINDYEYAVIGLVRLNNIGAWSAGRIWTARTNLLYNSAHIDYNFGAMYKGSGGAPYDICGTVIQYGNKYEVVAFKYNNVWYAGIKLNRGAAQEQIYVSSSKRDIAPFIIRYYNSNTKAVLNSEVNNSITTSYNKVTTNIYGNAESTTKLQTARTINGTSFNGTANITTATWGTARNIYIQDAPASYTGAAISVNGAANAYLRLPNSIVCGDWFRSTGTSGWYSNTYGGGIYMTDTTYVRVYNGKSFYCPSNILAAGEVTAYSSSDRRLKKNIKSISNSLDLIEKLNPVQFKWNKKAKELNKEKDERNNYGLIAQEVEEILPELVHPIYDKYKSVDYEQLIPILIQSIKELNDKINVLQNKINAK